MPSDRKYKNYTDSMFNNSISNPYVSKSFLDRNTNIQSVRDQEKGRNKSKLGQSSQKDVEKFDRNAKLG